MKNNNFEEALFHIKCGMTAELELNGTKRRYYLKDNDIICVPNGNEHQSYKIKDFKIDAVMSNNWTLLWN